MDRQRSPQFNHPGQLTPHFPTLQHVELQLEPKWRGKQRARQIVQCIKAGIEPAEALKKATGHYGQWDAAVKYIDPRKE